MTGKNVRQFKLPDNLDEWEKKHWAKYRAQQQKQEKDYQAWVSSTSWESVDPPESVPISDADGWVVYYLTAPFPHRGFPSVPEACDWLEPNATGAPATGWGGPIPIVRARVCGGFTGQRLATQPNPVPDNLDLAIEDSFGGNFPVRLASRWGIEQDLSSQKDRRLFRSALQQHSLRDPHYWLAPEWGFDDVWLEARNYPYHAASVQSATTLEHLTQAARELESALLSCFPDLSDEGAYNFWTSIQVHWHFADLTERITKHQGFDRASLHSILRWIGTYAAQFRPRTKVARGVIVVNEASNESIPPPIPDELPLAATVAEDPPAAAETISSTPNADDREKAQRAEIRSAWIDQKLAQQKTWTSDSDIANNGGPSYNTIKSFRSGAVSTRGRYVRRKLADAFKCDLPEVPA